MRMKGVRGLVCAVTVALVCAGQAQESTWSERNAQAAKLFVEERYDEAGAVARQALAAAEKAHGKDHPQVAASLNNLAVSLEALGKLGEAEPLYRRALAIRERVLGADHPDVAANLNNLALLCVAQGQGAKAEAYQRRAAGIWERTLGEAHPQTATGLEVLAELCRLQGAYSKAESLQLRACRGREKALGLLHPDTTISLASRAAILTALERHTEVMPVVVGLCENRVRQLTDLFPFCPLMERCAALGALQAGHSLVCSLVMSRPDADALAAATGLGYFLSAQGAVQDLLLEDSLTAVWSDTPALAEGMRELRLVKGRLARAMMRASTDADASGGGEPVSMLRSAARAIEEALACRAPRFAAVRDGRTASPLRVAAALPKDTALVLFVRYRAFDVLPRDGVSRPGVWRYAAYVVRSGDPAPFVMAMGEAWKIEERVRRYRKALEAMGQESGSGLVAEGDRPVDANVRVFRNPDGTLDFATLRNRKLGELQAASDALARLVWMPLLPRLAGALRVLIVPDGELNLVSFAGFRDEKGRYAIEDYRFAYLSTGRDLVRRPASCPTSSVPAVIFAAPDLAHASSAESKAAPGATAFRSRLADFDVFLGSYPSLAGLRGEADAVATILAGAGVRPVSHIGPEATETALKSIRRPRILHLATSAFLLPDGLWAREDRLESRLAGSFTVSPGDVARLCLQNPMHRSGVLLAGANEVIGGRRVDGAEDGIVTAEELGGLNLFGTELVVVSGCEARLGQALGGEGVLGLRRALVQAGVSGMVLSLWRTDDGVGRELMASFYRRYVSGSRLADALADAQREILARQRTLGGDPNPFLWAGLVAGGVGSP